MKQEAGAVRVELKIHDYGVYREAKAQAESEDMPLYAWIMLAMKEKLARSDKSRRWNDRVKV